MLRACLVSFLLIACGSSVAPLDGDGSHVDAGPTVRGDGAVPMSDAAPDLDAAEIPGLLRYPLQAEYPEGGTYDPVGEAFYVGSLGDGTVHRIDRATGDEVVFFTEDLPGTWWTLGMDVDVARHLLFVCAMDDQQETTSEDPPYLGYVWVLDLDTGERVARHDLSDAQTRATCTDVTVLRDGTAFVTDREHPNVYRIPPAGGVELFVTDDLLSGAVVGLNAIVATADESALLAIVYLPSRLVRIDMSTREVLDVEIDGDFLDTLPLLSGADGMDWAADGRLLVAFTSEITPVTAVLADWTVAESTSIDVPEGVTDVVVADGVPYLLNGQAVRFVLGSDPDPFALVRLAGFGP